MYPNSLTEPKSNLEYLQIENNAKSCICLFHGYGASMMDLYPLGEHIKTQKSYDWFFPNAHLDLPGGRHPMMMARAWFPIDMAALEQAMMRGTHRDFSDVYHENFIAALEKGQAFVESLFEQYDEVILGGFSQGSMITTHLALKNADKVKALLCYSGALIGRQQLIELLETSTKFPFLQSHGKRDPILSYSYAKDLFELLKLGGHHGEFISFDGEHGIPEVVLAKTQSFLDKL